VIGAAVALAAGRTAGATGLSADDTELVAFAIALELTARDLYDAAIDAGADGAVWGVMREQHESYAQRLAGISGVSANIRNDGVFDALEGAFRSDPAPAAFDLENVAAATHVELLGVVVDEDAAAAMASIAAIESRHATVLAGLAGRGDDLDALFLNTATPLSPEA
jgi:rubrerythrin